MDSRHKFKVAAIQARIEFCEAEQRQLLKMMTSSQVNIVWISERMDSIQKDLRFLHRDLEALEKRSEEGN
jgi:chromosome segregation ATPase